MIFAGTVFAEVLPVGTVFVVSLIPSHVISELAKILSKYLSFSQIYVTGLQI